MGNTERPYIADLAEKLGWSSYRTPRYGWRFIKISNGRERHIWQVRNGWQCADLIKGKFRNHRAGLWEGKDLFALLVNE